MPLKNFRNVRVPSMRKLKKFFTAALLSAALIVSCLSPGVQALPAEDVRIPIIMYHQVTTNPGLLGKYAITPDEFEADLIYLHDNNYRIVTITDLISYVYYGVELPKNPIVLTFDDGNYSDYRYVYPLLIKYSARAVISVIGSNTDQYTLENRQDIHYPNLTWYQINEMMLSGVIELQNHSYNLHGHGGGVSGAQKRSDESDVEYFARLKSDAAQLQNRALEKTGITPNTFTYPFGAYSPPSDEMLAQMGFYASLICEERINLLTVGNTSCLFGMGRSLRPHGITPGEFFECVDVDVIVD